MQLRLFVHVVSIFWSQARNLMDPMLPRDLLYLQATTVLTQSKLREYSLHMFWILWVACNFFRSYLRDMTLFISLNSSRFKTAVYWIFRLYRISFTVFFNGEFGGWSTNADGQKQLLLQIKIRSWVRTEWNAIIANHFSFFLFCFQTRDANVKYFFTFVHTRLNSKRFQRNFPEKGKGS